jgi:DNA-binding PadR family transcriptional regulator
MKKPAARKTLTELEGAALAIIKRRGPCTAYVVKEAFRTSPSEFWSGSAGAVYPLMKRLETRKLISSKADKSDGRARREFSVTKAGDAAITDWLTDAERASSLGFDPLRTRLFFCDLLTDGALRKFVAEVQREMEAKSEPPAEDLDHTHALHEQWMKLRLKALKAFANSLDT